MRSFPRAIVANHDMLAPYNLMRNMAEVAGIVNGYLDTDNIPPGLLTAAKVESGAWRNENEAKTTTAVTITGTAGAPCGVWQNVPLSSSTDPLALTINSQDAGLLIETKGKFEAPDLPARNMYIRVVVDGAHEVVGPPCGRSDFDSWWFTAFVPVGPGQHRVNVQFAFADTDGTGSMAAAWNRVFRARRLIVVEAKR